MIYSYSFFKTTLPDAQIKAFGIDLEIFFNTVGIKSFCIDSRNIESGQIFVALKGERVDAHEFIENVLGKNVSGLLVNKEWLEKLDKLDQKLLKNKIVIAVNDSLVSLKLLAIAWRKQFSYPVIGVTGSVGKTSTKEMLFHIFNTGNISAFASFKNQNTAIGLSLNILKMRKEHKFAIFEMGISHTGEMEELADILRPDIGVITYISHAHTDGLGSIEDIAKEKLKIFKFFESKNVGIICGDKDVLTKDFYPHFPLITFGKKTKNNIHARLIKITAAQEDIFGPNNFLTKFDLKIYSKKYKAVILGNHEGLINNALAATAVCTFLQIDAKIILKALATYKSFEGRYETIELKDKKAFLINDCYNASPESMKAAIKAFSLMHCKGKKIAVIGDMLELGSTEIFWHKLIGRFLIKSLDIDYLILVGKLAHLISKTAPVVIKTKKVENWKQAKDFLSELLDKNSDSLVLLKASHSIGLENIVKEFKA